MIAGDSTDQNILMIDWSVDDSNIGQCWSNIDDDWGFPNIWFLMIGEDQNRLWHIVTIKTCFFSRIFKHGSVLTKMDGRQT